MIMTRGGMITIRLDAKQLAAKKGDIAEVSFLVSGEVIPVGTWRVSTIIRKSMKGIR